jgi:hypothetical protein
LIEERRIVTFLTPIVAKSTSSVQEAWTWVMSVPAVIVLVAPAFQIVLTGHFLWSSLVARQLDYIGHTTMMTESMPVAI